MKILFVFDGLPVGGIERVGIDYINLLKREGHSVSILNLNPNKNAMYDNVPSWCKIVEFSLQRRVIPERYTKVIEKGVSGSILFCIINVVLSVVIILKKISFKIQRRIKHADIVIAFSGHFNDLKFVASDFIPRTKKIAWLHGAQYEYKVISDGYFALYRQIKNLVCLSELCDITCSKFNAENNIRKWKVYNPIMIQNKQVNKYVVNELNSKYGNYCLMVGRLSPDKDQDTAVKAIKYYNEKYGKTEHLVLVGDGPRRHEIEDLITKLNASEYVHLVGQRSDVQNYYCGAYIYIHSSPTEGLPTVLLEAMNFNVPIVATDSIPGVREILGNNEYGLVSPVSNHELLGENIFTLYTNEQERKRLIVRSAERIIDFGPERIIPIINEILEKI